MKKFNFTTSVTFTKIALKQTRVKTGGFSQILLFDMCNFRIISNSIAKAIALQSLKIAFNLAYLNILS